MKTVSRVLLSFARILPRGYWPLIRFAAARDEALWDLSLPTRIGSTVEIRADLRESVYIPVFKTGCYLHQIGEDLVCKELILEGDLVFDVGANIGYTTLLFSQAVGPSGKVLAFEPAPRTFKLLMRSLDQTNNVECLNLAISSRAGEASFYETATLDTSSLEAVEKVKPYTVAVDTLDSLARSHGHPAFVKIDVEGHEQWVFKGMESLILHDKPPILLFEALSEVVLSEILSVLNELTTNIYTYYRIKNDGQLTEMDDALGTNNYVALPAWGVTRAKKIIRAPKIDQSA